MDKDAHRRGRAGGGAGTGWASRGARARWRRQARVIAPWACAATLAASASAQEPYDQAYCEILARIAFDAAEMRADGLSQQQVAVRLSGLISDAVNTTPGPLRDRRAAADLLGAASTRILRFVYTVPMKGEEAPFPFRVAAFVFGTCAAGDV